MAETVKSSDQPFGSEAQNAIFNFLFILISEYSKTMPKNEAVQKACDWLTSLAADIKSKSIEFTKEKIDKEKQISQDT